MELTYWYMSFKLEIYFCQVTCRVKEARYFELDLKGTVYFVY